jgi:hypothetical protein
MLKSASHRTLPSGIHSRRMVFGSIRPRGVQTRQRVVLRSNRLPKFLPARRGTSACGLGQILAKHSEARLAQQRPIERLARICRALQFLYAVNFSRQQRCCRADITFLNEQDDKE